MILPVFKTGGRRVTPSPVRSTRTRFRQFHIDEYHLTHHAWVLDKLTGTRHELSIQDGDPHNVYIGKEFTKDEMIDRSDELLDEPESWMNMLTYESSSRCSGKRGTTWS